MLPVFPPWWWWVLAFIWWSAFNLHQVFTFLDYETLSSAYFNCKNVSQLTLMGQYWAFRIYRNSLTFWEQAWLRPDVRNPPTSISKTQINTHDVLIWLKPVSFSLTRVSVSLAAEIFQLFPSSSFPITVCSLNESAFRWQTYCARRDTLILDPWHWKNQE